MIAISKHPSHDRGRQCCDNLARILERKHLACGKIAPDKNLGYQEIVSRHNIKRNAGAKKKPGYAGLF